MSRMQKNEEPIDIEDMSDSHLDKVNAGITLEMIVKTVGGKVVSRVERYVDGKMMLHIGINIADCNGVAKQALRELMHPGIDVVWTTCDHEDCAELQEMATDCALDRHDRLYKEREAEFTKRQKESPDGIE